MVERYFGPIGIVVYTLCIIVGITLRQRKMKWERNKCAQVLPLYFGEGKKCMLNS